MVEDRRVEAGDFASEEVNGKIATWYYAVCPFCEIENTYLMYDGKQVAEDRATVCIHFEEPGWNGEKPVAYFHRATIAV